MSAKLELSFLERMGFRPSKGTIPVGNERVPGRFMLYRPGEDGSLFVEAIYSETRGGEHFYTKTAVIDKVPIFIKQDNPNVGELEDTLNTETATSCRYTNQDINQEDEPLQCV